MGIQMKRKEMTEKFIVTSNWGKPFDLSVYIKMFQRLKS